MKAKLNNLSRILLLNILKESEGNILAIKQIRELIPNVGFSDEELKETKLEALPNGNVQWQKDIDKEIEIEGAVYLIIKKKMDEIAKNEKFNLNWLDFAERCLKKEDFDSIGDKIKF